MAKLGKRTAKLLREAIVLAHVEGVRWGQVHARDDEYPSDSQVLARVLAAAVSFSDLYPTLSKLDEAKAARAAQQRTFIQDVLELMQSKQEDS